MNNAVIKVEKSGLSTSIQDLGRMGYQQYGMVVSGAMDPFALQVGNLLVGNERNAAGIEAVIMGPKLVFLKDTVIAICGADLSPQLDGKDIPMWKSFFVQKGQSLSFGQPKKGVYTYIAVAGGIDTPVVMGSRSTYVKAGIGGVNGRFLQKDDMLHSSDVKEKIRLRRLPDNLIPIYQSDQKIRVILGPDRDAFSQRTVETFLTGTYEITKQTDRMGMRLNGPKIQHVSKADIISDSIFLGTIQVPANGQPIILLADRQTTGGYTRIATVISVDVARVAQNLPGGKLQFEEISVQEAQALHIKQEKILRQLAVGARIY
ncbi:biotin-dependent carboxyltransferase family protein [Oceanobacillus sp. Castelsardo]|uniref:5-oxoprolinase subunit C family protein n=1 Tax=Oceanobacillus sp. Castelsardo TaxID=1851204 RepID=UPI0009ED8FB0|nr:biotin-dependent carboxyltransferase family protein [Oceanobacillus sp. Castelsardo]